MKHIRDRFSMMNGKERKIVIWMPLSLGILFTMFCLGETDWGFCAKLPCPPIPLAIGIIAILGLLAFFASVLYLIFGPEQENKIIPSGEEFIIDKQPLSNGVNHE